MKTARRFVGFLVFFGIVAAVLFGARQFIQSRGEEGPDEVSPVLDETTVAEADG